MKHCINVPRQSRRDVVGIEVQIAGLRHQNPSFTSTLWLDSGNKSTLVKVKKDFFCIETEHDLSLTLTKHCQCLNTTKQLNNAVVTTSA